MLLLGILKDLAVTRLVRGGDYERTDFGSLSDNQFLETMVL
jgi:hypothetical protein